MNRSTPFKKIFVCFLVSMLCVQPVRCVQPAPQAQSLKTKSMLFASGAGFLSSAIGFYLTVVALTNLFNEKNKINEEKSEEEKKDESEEEKKKKAEIEESIHLSTIASYVGLFMLFGGAGIAYFSDTYVRPYPPRATAPYQEYERYYQHWRNELPDSLFGLNRMSDEEFQAFLHIVRSRVNNGRGPLEDAWFKYDAYYKDSHTSDSFTYYHPNAHPEINASFQEYRRYYESEWQRKRGYDYARNPNNNIFTNMSPDEKAEFLRVLEENLNRRTNNGSNTNNNPSHNNASSNTSSHNNSSQTSNQAHGTANSSNTNNSSQHNRSSTNDNTANNRSSTNNSSNTNSSFSGRTLEDEMKGVATMLASFVSRSDYQGFEEDLRFRRTLTYLSYFSSLRMSDEIFESIVSEMKDVATVLGSFFSGNDYQGFENYLRIRRTFVYSFFSPSRMNSETFESFLRTIRFTCFSTSSNYNAEQQSSNTRAHYSSQSNGSTGSSTGSGKTHSNPFHSTGHSPSLARILFEFTYKALGDFRESDRYELEVIASNFEHSILHNDYERFEKYVRNQRTVPGSYFSPPRMSNGVLEAFLNLVRSQFFLNASNTHNHYSSQHNSGSSDEWFRNNNRGTDYFSGWSYQRTNNNSSSSTPHVNNSSSSANNNMLKIPSINASNEVKVDWALEFLGLTRAASMNDITKKCREFSMLYHPDRNKTPQASDYMAATNAAREILEEHFAPRARATS